MESKSSKRSSTIDLKVRLQVGTTYENHGKVRISVKSLKRLVALIRNSHLVSTFDVVST
jgi:hypothetical protein